MEMQNKQFHALSVKLKNKFLNLPLWANFYIYTDLSGTTTTTTLDQPTLLDDLNLNPQPG